MPQAIPALATALLLSRAALAAALPLEPAASAYADEKGTALRGPEGVACTDSGAVIAADTGNGRLVVYAFKNGGFAGGTELRVPELGRPVRLQIDSRGNLLSLDAKTRRIARVGAGGQFLGFLSMKGVPLARGFFPISFKLDAKDFAWILDAASQRVVVVDPQGAFVRQVDLPGGGLITDLALDARGTLHAVDAKKGVLYRLDQGRFVAVTSTLKEVLSFPGYLAVTAAGQIVVVDQHGMGLVVLARDGAYLGRRLSIGSNEGAVYYPAQICIDSAGDLFVADRGNQRIQAFTPPK